MKPTVLIIDDEPQNIELADIVLQKEGYRLLHAEDGIEALEVLENEHVQVIVLDIMMPKLNGFELLERLKNDERLKLIPVLVVTALGETAHQNMAKSLGADAYLIKPYDIIDLKMRVKAMLKIGEGLGQTPSEVIKLWFETMDEWMDARCRSHILAQMLEKLENDKSLLAPEAYTFICSFGKENFTHIANPVVEKALCEGSFAIDLQKEDIWTKLLRRLNVAIVQHKAKAAGLEAEPLLKSALGRYFLPQDL